MVAENEEIDDQHGVAICSPAFIDYPSIMDKDENLDWYHIALSSGASVERIPSGGYLIVRDRYKLALKKKSLIDGGSDSLQIISDFDHTLSRFYLNGKRGSTCHGCLETCSLLTDEYRECVQGLKAKYYPMEVDASIDPSRKFDLMVEWYSQSHKALLTSGLTKGIIKEAVSEANIGLRPGHGAFFDEINTKSVPLLIFSAGLADVLEEVIAQHSTVPPPELAHIISNRMIFNGDAFVGFKDPLFHVLNKRASTVIDEPYFASDLIKKRKHVLLLGDSLGDLYMTMGLDVTEVLSIGFLNDCVNERLEGYISGFDAVIIGPDAGLHYPLEILSEIPGPVQLSRSSWNGLKTEDEELIPAWQVLRDFCCLLP